MSMKKTLLLALLLCCGGALAQPKTVEEYQATADRIVARAQAGSELGWSRLSQLCTRFPHRKSGSAGLEHAIDWVVSEMARDGFDSVTTDPVMVPHWERGQERLTVLGEEPYDLALLGLGGSVATPPEGIEAPLWVVGSFDELERTREKARGRIVVFNAPFTTYGETGRYRWEGASRAAELGAVACLVRSVTPHSLGTPHTGGMSYDEKLPKIPNAAITPEAAQSFARRQAAGLPNRVRLVLTPQMLPDAPSRNVVAEIRGREHPEQVVLMGGHIDCWDVGEGAMDDGGGCLMCWEALRLLHDLGVKPRRTIRVVLWTNEENGLRGGKAYRQLRQAQVKDHVLAIESDEGTFHPSGFNYAGNAAARAVLQRVVGLLGAVGPMEITTPGGGADIGPLMAEGVPGAGLAHKDERYFWYHHSPADVLETIDLDDFRNCVATLAVTSFVVADMPERLPFGKAAEGGDAK
jgi:carboxypeptidase Q